MAGTTTDYSLPYPTGSDLVRNGDNAIQSLAEAVATLLADTFITRTEDTTSTTQQTNSTSYTNKTDLQVTFTTGASGVFQVILEGDIDTTSTSAICYCSVAITGAVTESASDSFSLQSQTIEQSRACVTKWFVGTPNTSTTVTLAMKAGAANTVNMYSGRLQVVTVG